MCVDNIAALSNFETYDLDKWKPSKKISFLEHPTSILSIRDIPVKITPNSVFVTDDNEVGAIWLMGQKKGFSDAERGMYADALFLDLNKRYSKKYTVIPKYCIAVDIVQNKILRYTQLDKGKVPTILKPTINEIIKLM